MRKHIIDETIKTKIKSIRGNKSRNLLKIKYWCLKTDVKYQSHCESEFHAESKKKVIEPFKKL